MSWCVYKYQKGKNIYYIGLTSDLSRRIKEHEIEEKFRNQIFDIYYFPCSGKTEAIAYEYCLINKHKPVLNIKDKQTEKTLNIEEPSWELYTSKKAPKEVKSKENKKISEWLTVAEYANRRGVSKQAVYKRIGKGTLISKEINGIKHVLSDFVTEIEEKPSIAKKKRWGLFKK